MAKEFSRTDRVADFLKQELARLIQFEVRDPRLGLVSVTDVEVTRDLSSAKVFVSFMDKESAEEVEEQLAVLNKATGFLRSQVARLHTMRTTPRLRFYHDATLSQGQSISALIHKALEADRKLAQGHSETQDEE